MKILLFLIIFCELAQVSERVIEKSLRERSEMKSAKLTIPNVYDFFPESSSAATSAVAVD